MTQSQESRHYSGELFNLWDSYRETVVSERVSHRALADAVGQTLGSHFAGRGFSVLERQAREAGLKPLAGGARFGPRRLMCFVRN